MSLTSEAEVRRCQRHLPSDPRRRIRTPVRISSALGVRAASNFPVDTVESLLFGILRPRNTPARIASASGRRRRCCHAPETWFRRGPQRMLRANTTYRRQGRRHSITSHHASASPHADLAASHDKCDATCGNARTDRTRLQLCGNFRRTFACLPLGARRGPTNDDVIR